MVKGTGEGKYHGVSDFARKDLGEGKMYLHLYLTPTLGESVRSHWGWGWSTHVEYLVLNKQDAGWTQESV
jgi:hypothetical protein